MSNVVPFNSTIAAQQQYERRLAVALADMSAASAHFTREFTTAMVDATLAGVDSAHIVAYGEAASIEVLRTFTEQLLRVKAELIAKYGVKG